jgi:hypothetical protein
MLPLAHPTVGRPPVPRDPARPAAPRSGQRTPASPPAPGAAGAAGADDRAGPLRAREDAPADRLAPGAGAAPAARRFSETAWFLAAQDPAELHDVPPGTPAADESVRYEVEAKLPDDVRRRFSLSDTVPRMAALEEPWTDDEPLPDDDEPLPGPEPRP